MSKKKHKHRPRPHPQQEGKLSNGQTGGPLQTINGVPGTPSKAFRPREQRQAWLTSEDLEVLIHLLDKAGLGKGALTTYLSSVRRQFSDDCLRLRELEARVKANAFWEEEHGTAVRIRVLRKEAKRRHRKVLEQIHCLTPEQMAPVIEEVLHPKPIIEE